MKINKTLFWIYAISSGIYFTQGIEGIPGLALFFYLKEKLHFDASTIMYISSIASLAWLIKPVWGYLCDNYLTKKKWILISLLGSIAVCLYLGLSSFLPIIVLIGLLSFSSFNAALRDVSIDGIMCVEGKKTNDCGNIQTVQWTSITIASIIVGLVGGYIADHFNYQFGYLCLIPVYILILSLVLRYRTSVHTNRTIESCTNCIHSDVCDFSGYGWCQDYKQEKTRIWETICSYKVLFTNKKFLFACLFLFLYKFNPSFGTPLMFIERDVFKWSGTWLGTLAAIVSIFEILGALIYFKMNKKINIYKWLLYSVFLGAGVTLCYLYFTPISCIIYGCMFSLIGMLIHLIVMSWMAESTIKGKEATSFALLCSINNLAATASTITGAWLYPILGLQGLIILAAGTSFLCLLFIKKIF